MTTPEHREIPIHLVDDPPAPTRQAIDTHYIDQLAASIKALGQLQPGGVVPNGERFDVVYGHCRLLACRQAGVECYRAYVYDSTSEAMLSAQLHENARRAKVNPVDEAYWFAQLCDGLQWGTDELAAQLNVTRDYVEARLNLLRGDPHVLDALQAGRIQLGVAKLLMKYPHDGDRLVLLDAAIAGGATERLVAQWISDRARMVADGVELPVTPQDHVLNTSIAAAPQQNACLFCGSAEHPWLMSPVWMHTPCRDIVNRLLVKHGGNLHEQKDPVADRPRDPAAADR